jgi:hypothetical protein
VDVSEDQAAEMLNCKINFEGSVRLVALKDPAVNQEAAAT